MAQTKKKTRTVRTTRSKTRKPAKTTLKAPVNKAVASVRPRKGRLTPFKKQELDKFRGLLIEEYERLKAELDELEARAARALEIEAAGELSDYDDHPADVASETFEREKDLAIADSTASLLAKVNNALEKINKGTYGVCDICGGPIKRARLSAIPFATLCVECQERMEV